MMKQRWHIEPLSQSTLADATSLVHAVFPEDAKNQISSPGLALTISLDPHNIQYKKFWQNDIADWFTYYVALDKEKVIGTTGLYHQKEESEEIVWLGWYCVSPEYRGQGIGEQLLEFTIATAKNLRKTHLKLYTEDTFESAKKIYDAFGFETIAIEEKDGWKRIDKILALHN